MEPIIKEHADVHNDPFFFFKKKNPIKLIASDEKSCIMGPIIKEHVDVNNETHLAVDSSTLP